MWPLATLPRLVCRTQPQWPSPSQLWTNRSPGRTSSPGRRSTAYSSTLGLGLGLGLGLAADILLDEVAALPAGWQHLSYSDVSLVLFRFLLIQVYTCVFVYAAYSVACLDRGYWRPQALFLVVFFLIDWESEEDARTGLPEAAPGGALKMIQEAVMADSSLEETLVALFQHTRTMETSTCAFGCKVFDMFVQTRSFDYQTIISYAIPCMYNLLLACHFCICSVDDFMIVF